MKFELAGRYRIQAVHKDTGAVRELAPWFDNLILDSGLNQMGTGSPFGYCMVGSGSTAPANAQTGLSTQVANTTNIIANTSGVEIGSGYAWQRRTYRFAAGVAAGNISEVGVGWSSLACFSRALVVDGGGTPTTITVLSDEYLDVTYELRTYWPATDVTATVTIDGSSYDTVARAAIVGNWSPLLLQAGLNMAVVPTAYGVHAIFTGGTPGNLGDVTVDPGGSNMGQPTNSGTVGAYSNNSLQRNYQITADPFGGVVSPISAIRVITPLGYFKASFNPSIPKTNLNTVTINFRVSWARRVI
jgi:hypothetical protein